MKRILTLFLVILMPVMTFASPEGPTKYKLLYDGGTGLSVKSGKSIGVAFQGQDVLLFDGKNSLATIPVSAITEVSYGQATRRRVGEAVGVAFISLGIGALLLLSKEHTEYIGVTTSNPDGTKAAYIFRTLDKSAYHSVLLSLQAATGKPAVDSDAMTTK
jgi:hypothetical protein